MLLTPMGVDMEMSERTLERASRMWWELLLVGILSVAVGVVILAIDWTVEGLAFMVGAIFMARGILLALSPSLSRSGRRWNIATGVLWVIAGAAFVAWPSPTLLVLSIFIGAALIVDGIMHLAGAIAFRQDMESWWLHALFGVGIAAIGFLALRRPDLTLAGLVLLAGLWAIVIGAVEVVSAFILRTAPDELARVRSTAGAAGVVEGTIMLGRSGLPAEEQLIMLDELHDSGSLTDDEYEQARSRLVGTYGPGGA